MDNQHRRGFRWVGNITGDNHPPIEEWPVASGYRALSTVTTPFYYDWKEGDPCIQVAGGGIEICAGAEDDAPAARVFGIIAGWKPLWDAANGRMHPSKQYPSAGVTWGTNLTRQSFALVIPVLGQYFAIDVDDNSTATTLAAYQAFRGENVSHVLDYQQSVSGDMDPRLDISSHNTTASLLWRIVGISKNAKNQDYSGANVELIVTANVQQQAPVYATGT